MSDPRTRVVFEMTKVQCQWLLTFLVFGSAASSVLSLVLGPVLHDWHAAWTAQVLATTLILLEQWFDKRVRSVQR